MPSSACPTHPLPHRASIDIIDPHHRLEPGPCAWLRQRLEEAAAALGCAGEVRVRVVDDAEMAAAHERFSGVSGTTDVLTFDLRDDPTGPLDADLLVCADEGARHGAALGHPVERELLLYALHGLLHCLGHDDHDPAAAAAMHAREDQVLRAIGVGDTFAPGGGAPHAAEARP